MILFAILSVLFGIETDNSITIIYANDINGSLGPSKAYWVSPDMPPDLGNAKSLGVLVEQERKLSDILLLNSGNLAPLNIPGEKKTPEELACFLNELKFDATLIGTNELSFGKDFLQKLKEGSSTEFLSANLSGDQKGAIITTKNNIKIGIFGITSPYVPLFVPKRFRESTEVDPDIEKAAKESVCNLKNSGAELIIGLSDAGYMRDSIIAETVGNIDCIIGSSNRGRALREPFETPIKHTLLCKTYSNLSSAGKLVLYLDTDNNIAGYEHTLLTLFMEEYPSYK